MPTAPVAAGGVDAGSCESERECAKGFSGKWAIAGL
jgi:hypothetical protein